MYNKIRNIIGKFVGNKIITYNIVNNISLKKK